MPLQFVDDEQKPEPNVWDDIAGSLAAGVGRGVASVPGMIGDLQRAGEAAAVWGRGKIAGPEAAEELRRQQEQAGRNDILPRPPTTEELVQRAAPYLPGIAYEPQTRAGRYVRTGAEFGVGAVAGPMRSVPSVVGRSLVTGVLPGLASEAAGQATEGKDFEPWARGGAAVLTGLLGGQVVKPGTPGEVIRRAADGITPAQLDAAERLFQDAERMGIPISRAQAAQAVTNGATSLGDLQRVIEGTGNMRGFFAPTAEGIRTTGEDVLDRVAPRNPANSMVGPAMREPAQAAINRQNQRINRITQPNYDRVGMTPHGYMQIPPEDMAVLMDQPLYRETIGEVRQNPNLSQQVEGLPDASIPFNDLVQRRMGENIDEVDPTRSLSRLERAGATSQRQVVRDAMDSATGGEISTVWQEQQRLRQRYLEPLLQGPLGKLAARDQTTAQAIDALFPGDPRALPGSGEVATTISRLRNSPGGEVAAEHLVRSYLQATFDQATRTLQGGANQWGGATFNAALRGNPQMAENLRAAVTSLPNGAERWAGFERFLEVLEATGQRQRPGSATSFNNELLQQLERGGVLSDVAKSATGSPLALPQRIRDQINLMNMGRNTAEVARLLTDPRMGARFRELATAPVGSAKAIRLVGSLAAQVQRSQNADNEYDPGQSLAAPQARKLRFID